ncbi:MAG: S-layer homology domain-containing protein [Clostridia bacterium]|nr:S-layer homology domain-containing protein [Clostridia bacterium]
MKRIVSLVLALSMVLGLCATSFAATLEDVENTKFASAVEALVELEVVAGYPDGTYKPEKEVNRAELAKMIVICMGLDEDAERAQADNIFTDESLKEGEAFAWARGYVNTAAAAGVIKGYPTGDFKPEKTVTYAEALTMMLRALGYGNVMEEEGSWPTNAILKARELELTDDVKYASSSDGAVRGDIAILLWNMLRTPMWKITSENQGTGMTSEASKKMLNVKFPDYMYDDEAVVESFEIEDGEVTLTLVYEDEDAEDVVGTLTSGDLLRLVKGMKVSYLYNVEDEEFLTVTAVDELVEGRVDEELEVNGKEYKDMEAAEGEYVVLLVDGKKVVAEVVLPEEAYEIGREKTLKKAKKDIGEDALVIIDGEWLTAEELEEGDVVTKVAPADNEANEGEESFYVVARERVSGEFESLTYDEDAEEIRYYLEIDGKEYEADRDAITVYEYDEDEEDYVNVTEDAVGDEETEGEFDDKKGKYFGEEVEVALDYLGNVVNLYFGEVKDSEDTDYNFYVMTGKYAWDDSSRDGRVYYYDLSNGEGEDTYVFTTELYNDVLGLDSYEDTSSFEELNQYVDDEAALAKALVDRVFAATLNDDEALEYDEEKYAENFSEMYTADVTADDEEDDILDDDDKNYLVGHDAEGDKKVTSSTVVYTIKAVIEENEDGEEEVTGIEVEVSEGTEALEGVEYAKFVVAVDGDGEEARVASYVFVGADAKSTDLNFGLVERFTSRAGIDYITISGEKYEIDEESVIPEIGDAVSYRVSEDVVTIRDIMVETDIDDEKVVMVEKVEDGVIYLSNEDTLDTDRKATKDEYKDTLFVLVGASLDEDDNVEFDADVEVLGEGIENASFKKGDRLLQGKVDENLIAIVRGLSEKDTFTAGALVIE